MKDPRARRMEIALDLLDELHAQQKPNPHAAFASVAQRHNITAYRVRAVVDRILGEHAETLASALRSMA